MNFDITQQFNSYVQTKYQVTHHNNWLTSNFLKLSQNILLELQTLSKKVNELTNWVKMSSRFDRNQLTKRSQNLKEGIRMESQAIKRLNTMTLDIKSSSQQTLNKLKNTIIATLEMKLLFITTQSKEIYLKPNPKIIQSNESTQQINLNKAHFLEQTQQEMVEETMKNQYKDIEKSIIEISEMYTQTMEVLDLQRMYVDRICDNIVDIDMNVEGGRKNLSEVQRNEHKNRGIIIKLFVVLYIITFIYTVFLS